MSRQLLTMESLQIGLHHLPLDLWSLQLLQTLRIALLDKFSLDESYSRRDWMDQVPLRRYVSFSLIQTFDEMLATDS